MTRALCAANWACRLAVAAIAVGLVMGGSAIVALAQGVPTPVQDTTQLWAQLITAGVILGIGVWAIKSFLTFKEDAVKQDTSLQSKLDELNHALMGVQGHGGLLDASRVDRDRRHEMGNQMVRLNERLHDMAVLLERCCATVGVPFDESLLEDS